MSRTLAIGYVLCIATLGVMILLGSGTIPQLDGFSAFFYSSLVGLLMWVVPVLCFRGAHHLMDVFARFSPTWFRSCLCSLD